MPSEVIVQTNSHSVDSILQDSREGRPVSGVGQSEVVGAKVIIVVFEVRGPVRGERPIQTCASRPAGLRRRRARIDCKPREWRRVSNVTFFTGPGGATSDINEPTAKSGVA